MQLAYGSYYFVANAVEIVARSDVKRNKGGQPASVVQSLEVAGFLQGSGQADLTAQMSTLYGVLKTPYKDLIFYQDDAVTQSTTFLKNAGSLSGVVIVKGPDFTRNDGGEYNQYRHFEFTAEAEYPLPNTANLLLEFTEKLRFRGGGPIFGHKLSINGPPQKQLLYPQSIFRVTQTGHAVGFLKYPIPPPALWPFALKESPDNEAVSPELKGKAYDGYPVHWAYEFESASALTGAPHLWIP